MNPPQTRLVTQGHAIQLALTASYSPLYSDAKKPCIHLKSEDGAVNLKLPHDILPTIQPGETIIVTLGLVRVAVEPINDEPQTGPLLLPDRKIIKPSEVQ